jgi:membrane-bound serine protease (ClpP class)
VKRILSVAAVLAGFLLLPSPAGASGGPSVDVVKVQGAIDPSLAAYVRGTLRAAQADGAPVILQIDSRGSLGDEAVELGSEIRSATVPVIAWVGPSGARAAGGALFLVYSSSLAAMAPGAGIGPARPFDLGTGTSRENPAVVAQLSAQLEVLGPGAEATSAGVAGLIDGPALPAGPALDAGAVALVAVDIPDLLQKLDGRVVRTPSGSVTLRTLSKPGSEVVVRFHEIGLVRRVLHAVSTPTAVYVLLVLGLWGIVFELTQTGIGISGIGGLAALALAVYGLTVIPVHWLGLILILGGTALMGLDVMIRRLGLFTAAGTAAFATGSVVAWRGVAPAIDLSLWLIVFLSLAGTLFFGFGLTIALKARERVRTAQVGLVGLLGEVRTELNPEGGVYVKGALWRARSMNGHIAKGARVRVKGVEGLILRVEQEPDD